MKSVFRNIIGLVLAGLVLVGNAGFPVILHTCKAQGQTVFYLDSERIECLRTSKDCCLSSGPMEHSYLHPENDTFLKQSSCCETSSKTVKLEPYTISYNTENNPDLKSVRSLITLNLFSRDFVKMKTDDLQQRHQPNNDLIPLIIAKERLLQYYNQKNSSDPLIA